MNIMNLNNLFLTTAQGDLLRKPRSNYSQEYGSSQSSQVWTRGNGEQ